MGLFIAVVIHNFEIQTKDGTPLFHANFHFLFIGQAQVLVFQGAHGTQRAEFGHAPCMQHLNAIQVIEGINHGGRARRATNDGSLQMVEAQIVGFQMS